MELAIETTTIGSSAATFHNYIEKGSIVFFHCSGQVWGKAKVVSEAITNHEPIWGDKVYPYRFRIDQVSMLESPYGLSGSKEASILREEFGSGWAYKFIFVPKPLPVEVGQLLLTKFG